MARKRATSKAQLIHANAAPAAQLVTAHAQTQTATASAPLASAPTASRRRAASPNPSLPAPVQVGGEKQHHQGFETQTATVGGTDLTLHQMKDGSFQLRDPNGNVRRNYSAGQMAHITRRGNSGATMDPLDSAAFFRIGGGKTDEEKEEEKRLRLKDEAENDRIKKKKEDQEEEITRRREALWNQGVDGEFFKYGGAETLGQLDAAEDKLKSKQKEAELKDQKDAQLELYKKQQEYAHQQKLEQEKAENDAFNKKWGIEDGITLSQKDKDDINAGRSRWGYSAQDQQSIDDINKAFAEGNYNRERKDHYVGADGRARQLTQGDSGYTGQQLITEYDAMRNNADAQIAGYRKGVQKNTDERTAEQIYNGAFEINGVRYYSPDGRSLVPIDEGQKAQAARDARAQERADAQQIRAQERADNRADALQKRIDDYEKSVVDKLMTPDENGNGMSFDEALAEARKRSAAFFTQPSAPTTQPTAQPTTTQTATQPPPNPSSTDWRNNPLFK